MACASKVGPLKPFLAVTAPEHKRHHGLAYHYTREAVASKAISFHHIAGTMNPADIPSNHWGYQKVWSFLQPILFWQGDTIDLIKNNNHNDKRKGSDK